MNKKLSIVATALISALVAGQAFADTPKSSDVLTSGWEINGYASSNIRDLSRGATTDNEFGKPDYKTAGTFGKSTNQVEFVLKKKTEHANGAWSNFVTRSEYGNGNSWAYSSSGGQKQNGENQFEIKEAYIELGGMPTFGKDFSIWGGQRFLNRNAGLLSGEFWKQSSGVGAGIEQKLGDQKLGFAVVMADPEAGQDPSLLPKDARNTLRSHDLYWHNIDVGFGKLDFDVKYMRQANKDGFKDAQGREISNKDGVGAAITLNTNYYGLDGWAQTALTYGEGVAQNRGVNFGGWAGGDENQEALFFTTYGVMNINSDWQFGSEITHHRALDQLFGAEDLERTIIAVRPSYRLDENLRLEFTGSWGHETGKEGYFGGRMGDAVSNSYWTAEIAVPFTVNPDFFGRPQIKPYVAYVAADDRASARQIDLVGTGKDQTIVGVHAEIWF